MSLVIAPTEPKRLKAEGKVSLLPERYGVDVFWVSRAKLWGIQRKEFSDFLASIQDGRLARERGQMKSLDHAVLIIEGKPRWTLDGQLISDRGYGPAWSKQAHRNYLLGVMAEGIVVEHTDGLDDTILRVREIQAWSQRDHLSGVQRPKPQSSWGKAGHRDFALHLLQSFDGVGPKMAAAILDHFGKVPMRWECGVDELTSIAGVGPVRAQRLMKALERCVEEEVA